MLGKAPRDVQLYCSWFCPFAQRAWIAVEEKGVDYQYCEVNPYEVNPDEPGGYTKRQLPLAEKAAVNGAAFIAASPRGLVPALSHGGKPVWESLPLVEYVDEAFEGAAMMPTDPHERALVSRRDAAPMPAAGTTPICLSPPRRHHARFAVLNIAKCKNTPTPCIAVYKEPAWFVLI